VGRWARPDGLGHGIGLRGFGGGIIMKSLQELHDEVKGDDALKKSFAEAMRESTAEDFLREHGCEATLEEPS